MQLTQGTLLKHLAPGAREEPHYWASQDTLYTKLLFQDPGM